MPKASHQPLSQRIQEGRRMLREVTGKDFGYDLAACHNHRKESREGGYTWGRNIILPRIMKAALASKEWQSVVEDLKDET
jgi:hypothetical protein